jgi:hypothetical protein
MHFKEAPDETRFPDPGIARDEDEPSPSADCVG